MFPETLVVLICTLDQSGCCCAHVAGPQSSAAPTRERTIQVRNFLHISILLRKAGILPLWTATRGTRKGKAIRSNWLYQCIAHAPQCGRLHRSLPRERGCGVPVDRRSEGRCWPELTGESLPRRIDVLLYR